MRILLFYRNSTIHKIYNYKHPECQQWCQSPTEKENQLCQECTQKGTSKFIEKIEEIEWRQEINNLKRSLDKMKAENLALRSMMEHHVFNTRSIMRNNIRFYDEIYNLYKTRSENIEHYLASTRIPYYNIYL